MSIALRHLCFSVSFALSLIAHSAVAAPMYSSGKISAIVSVYDADTFRVDLEDWPAIVGKNMPIRVKGVDAPEIRGKCPSEKQQARSAKAFTQQLLATADTIELRNIERGKYFRLLADVYIDGENLALSLIHAQLARTYDGGTRLGWCD